MAMVEIEVAARRYSIACRDGEEPHLREVAAIVDNKASDAAQAVGGLSEARHLLYASLLLADELHEVRAHAAGGDGAAGEAHPDADIAAEAIERLAERVERLASRLESGGHSS
jgi:cell division protein ZapA